MRRLLAIVAAAFLVTTAACAASLPDFTAGPTTEPPITTAPIGTAPTIPASTTTTEPPIVVPEQLIGLEVQPITIVDGDGVWSLTVAVADDGATRSRGLMDVADLGDLDGMLFVWQEPTTTGFWMQDVILPLDIAFFGEDLVRVDNFTMPLCTAEDCPTYSAAGSFTYAVEVLDGTFTDMSSVARLVLGPYSG